MALFRILLIIVLFFYAFSLIVKMIFNRKMKKVERQMKEHFSQDDHEPQKEQQNPHIDPNIGEYTEFEEVE